MNSFDILKRKLIKIKDRGFIETYRSGNTGVGYTLETLLELDENNGSGSDYDGIEIKAKRHKSSSAKITAFTQAPIYESKPKDFVKKHGDWKDDQNRFNLYSTVSFKKPNSHGLFLCFEQDPVHGEVLCVKSTKTNETICKWPMSILVFRQEQKLSKVFVVHAQTEGRGKYERFYYDRADFYSNPTPTNIRKLIKQRTLIVDLRFWFDPKLDKLRDRGVAFRIGESNWHLMYSNHEKIL